MMYPKVSCVMITAGRPDKVRRSVQCYLCQNYPNKELVILSQGTDAANEELRNYVTSLDGNNISFFTAPSALSLGGMRNLSVELTRGEIVCQWDDDDLSHPLRLTRQYNALAGDGVVASAYHEYLKWFEDNDEIYWVDWSIEEIEDERYLHGTAMYRKELFCESENMLYPERSGREEDWNAVQKMLKRGRIAGIKDGYHYIYTYHGDNVYWRAHHELALQKRIYTRSELLDRRSLIERSLRECGVERPVKICSMEGVAFEFYPET